MNNKAIKALDALEAALLERAARRPKPTPAAQQPALDAQRLRAFEYYEFNVGLPVVEQSCRARALREIARVSTWYGLGAEVTRALDREGVSAAGELSDIGVESLLDRMKHLEDAIQSGCDTADIPPAR